MRSTHLLYSKHFATPTTYHYKLSCVGFGLTLFIRLHTIIYSLCGNFGSPVKTLVIDTGLIAIENVGTVLFLSF